jgi:antitoxin (DNA-binding transcriptional repressor) of toxin-antitoxin stability system
MVQYLVMLRVNIHEAKTHLSRYVKRVLRGERVLLCRRNQPIAEIRPLPRSRETPRPLGLARSEYGEYHLPASFFEPLPDEILEAFAGGGSGGRGEPGGGSGAQEHGGGERTDPRSSGTAS